MNQTNDNLPAVISDKKGISKLEKEHPRLVNYLKRTGKITGYLLGGLGFAFVGATGTLVTLPAISALASVVGFTGTVGMLTKAGINVRFQNEDDLLFTAKRGFKDGELKLFQRTDVMNKIKGLSTTQLAGLMTLNTLVGFERYKSLINTSKFTYEDEKKVYDQKFSTKTHSVNIKNFKLLEKLGYIKIDDISEVQGKSSLLVEKIALGNMKGVKDYFSLLLSGDKEKIEKSKVNMQTVKFRLTDKKIDLLEMYKNYQECKKDKKPVDRIAMVLFDERIGILAPNLSSSKEMYHGKKDELQDKKSNNEVIKEEPKAKKKTLRLRRTRKIDKARKIGIEYDSLGRPYINYDAKQSGTELFNTILVASTKKEKRQEFIESIEQNVEPSNTIQFDKEKIVRKNQEREIS